MTMPIDIPYATVATAATPHIGAVLDALAQVAGCEPQADAKGNLQSVVRADPAEGGGFTITYPAAVNAATVTSAIATAKTAATQIGIERGLEWLAIPVLTERLVNNLDDVKNARAAIAIGQLFPTASQAERNFLLVVCDQLDALARLRVRVYELVD